MTNKTRSNRNSINRTNQDYSKKPEIYFVYICHLNIEIVNRQTKK